MVHIIFDGNYILHKNIFTLIKTNTLYADFHKAMTVNIEKFVNMLPNSKIHIVFDGKRTWRKQLYDTYKATRVKDETIDWKWIFNELDIWIDSVLESTSWNIYRDQLLEGDDWIMGLVKYNNKNNESNIVIASDRDLLQLLKWNDKYINIQLRDIMTQEKAYLPEGYMIFKKQNEESNEDDLFNFSGSNKLGLSTFLDNIISNWKIEEINTKQFLFEKIIKGDSGDNIKSIYTKLTKTGKPQGIGDGGANKIWNIYSELYGQEYKTSNNEFKDKIIECLELKEKKIFDDSIKKTIKCNIEHNIKIMELNPKYYPDNVLEIMMENIK